MYELCFFSSSFFTPQWDVLICPDWWGWKQAVWLLSPITGMHLKCCCPLSLASLNFIFPYYKLACPIFVVLPSNLSLIISYFLNLVAKIMDFSPLNIISKSAKKALLCSTSLILWLYLDEQSCDAPVFWICLFLHSPVVKAEGSPRSTALSAAWAASISSPR